MKHTPLLFLTLTFALAVAAGCKKSPPAPADKHDDHAAHMDHAGHGDGHDHAAHMKQLEAEAAAKEPEAAGPKIETGSFLLEVSPAQPTYAAGKPGERSAGPGADRPPGRSWPAAASRG